MCRIVAIVLLAGFSQLAFADSDADRWNLADIYPTLAAWNADAERLHAQVGDYVSCKGQLGDSAKRFGECLALRYDMQKRYYRLAMYASQQLAADTSAQASLALDQRADLLGNDYDKADSFFDPEVLTLGKARVDAMLTTDPALSIYRFSLDRILRAAPHTLDAEGEALIAQFGRMNDAGQSTYSILANADMPWPTIKLADGTEVKLDAQGYEKSRETSNRDDRRRIRDAHLGEVKDFERTFGTTLYAQLKQQAVYAKVRKYPDSLAAALDRNAIPQAVFDTLIAQTNANLATLQRYLRLRATMLGVSDLHYYDLYPPMAKGDYKFPYAEGRELVLEAVAPLGKDYVDALRHGLDSRWMDLYPRPHKQSGAHMAGYAYDVHPYVLLNYNDSYESVSTLAHEWGHAMHSYLASRAQPFVTANYATFVAEIASTFNEQLLLDRMLKSAKSDDEKLYYLGNALDQLRGTFFLQAMFTEFERGAHARVDKGEPVTGAELTHLYCDLLKRYNGADKGVITIDDADCVGWALVPHFYYGYYVYKYATSIAASALFAQRVVDKEPGALDRYMKLLKSGASDYPYELVKAAGVDLATPAPYEALFARMNAIMDQMEAILARQQKARKPAG